MRRRLPPAQLTRPVPPPSASPRCRGREPPFARPEHVPWGWRPSQIEDCSGNGGLPRRSAADPCSLQQARNIRSPPPRNEVTEQIINDLTIQAATVNGSGSQTANLVLTRAIFTHGNPGRAQECLSLQHRGPAHLVSAPDHARGPYGANRPGRRPHSFQPVDLARRHQDGPAGRAP